MACLDDSLWLDEQWTGRPGDAAIIFCCCRRLVVLWALVKYLAYLTPLHCVLFILSLLLTTTPPPPPPKPQPATCATAHTYHNLVLDAECSSNWLAGEGITRWGRVFDLCTFVSFVTVMSAFIVKLATLTY